MVNFEIEPKSRADLRRIAAYLRELVGLSEEKYFPVIDMLDVLCEIDPQFSYEVVNDDELPKDIHADTDVLTRHIRIKESVYDGACNGKGRDRMTIAHEIGHYMTICICGFKFHRRFGKEKLPAYRDPEWQAKCFAGELLMKREHIEFLTVDEIMESCGVSRSAARFHYCLLHGVPYRRCA